MLNLPYIHSSIHIHVCFGPTQIFHKAGLPAGLVNLVTGKGSEIGDFLTQHPSVNCISFTGGSTGGAIADVAKVDFLCNTLMIHS